MLCKICGKEFSHMGKHLMYTHPDITPEQYYDTYIDSNAHKCQRVGCINRCTLISMKKGYHKYCCTTCASIDNYESTKKSLHNPETTLRRSETQKKKNAIKRESIKQEKIDKIDHNNIYQCQICGEIMESIDYLAKHVKSHDITAQDYYDKYIIKDPNTQLCSVCGQYGLSFISMREGYRKYHAGCSQKSKAVKEKNKIIIIKKLKERIEKYQKTLDVEFINIDEVTSDSTLAKIRCLKCNQIYENRWYNLSLGWGKCPICHPKYIKNSKPQVEIYDFIKSSNPLINIVQSYNGLIRSKINIPLELDLYLPDKSIAIEFNGLYWHNDEIQKDNNYHLYKTLECQNKGVRLVHIFEDEWIHKQDIVKNKILNIIGSSNSKKINARECIVKEISANIKNEFLNKYHIQGQDTSVIKLGLFFQNELVSVCTFGRGNISRGGNPTDKLIWELSRFSTNHDYSVRGGAGKLLEFFKRNYDWKTIFSYADFRWSVGNLYTKLGFKFVHLSRPEYWYVDTSHRIRIHRFNLRKTKDDPVDIPEYILRANQGYKRIWDCGHIKFELYNT
jgi:hypothetical protein